MEKKGYLLHFCNFEDVTYPDQDAWCVPFCNSRGRVCIASSTSFWEMVVAFLFSSNQGSTKTHANHLSRKSMVFAAWNTHIKSQMISTLHPVSLCTFFFLESMWCIHIQLHSEWSTYTCLHCIVHNQSTAMQRGHECAWVWQGIIEARGR